MNHKDSLNYGVEYPAGSGVLHYEFEMRLPMVGDNVAAIEQVGVDSNLKLNVAMFARTLVKLGDIPREEITFELLDQHMVDDDYDVLSGARDELKKKRLQPKSTLPTSGSQSSSSASTESPKPASES